MLPYIKYISTSCKMCCLILMVQSVLHQLLRLDNKCKIMCCYVKKYIWTSCKMCCVIIALVKCVIQRVLWLCSRRCVLLHLHGDVGHILYQRHQHTRGYQRHWGWTEPYHCSLCRHLQPRRNQWSVHCRPLPIWPVHEQTYWANMSVA